MILLLLAAAAAQAGPSAISRDDRCMALAAKDPKAAEEEAGRWERADGGYRPRQCAAAAYAAEERWDLAAGAFDAAARGAERARDGAAANLWAQAGNAWLAAGDATRAKAALDTALASGMLKDLALGEAQLDRARALVAGGDEAGARSDLDHALLTAGDDPLAWLLSATLARRMHELPRASRDIAQALQRSPDDASVQLEAGNIAASAGDEAGARSAWAQAVRIAPDAPTGKNAAVALAQFGEAKQ